MTVGDLSRFYGPDYIQPGTGGDGIGPSYGNWDAYSTTACFCDRGHFGADCSKRERTRSRYDVESVCHSGGNNAQSFQTLSFGQVKI